MVDIVVLYVASSMALLASAPVRDVVGDRWLAAGFPLVVLAIMVGRRSPDTRLSGSLLEVSARVFGLVSLAAMVTLSIASVLGGVHPIDPVLRLWLFAGVYLAVARSVLLSIRRQAMSTDALATPTLIVGAGAVGEHLAKRLLGEPRYGLRPVGFLDSDPLRRPQDGLGAPDVPVLGGAHDLAAAIERTGARHVIVAFTTEPDHILVQNVKHCQQLGVQVSLVPRLYESVNQRDTLDHVGGLPLVSLHAIDPRGRQLDVKHAIDRACALLALSILGPVMIATAVAVRLSSPGPVLFRQRRVGRDGHQFDILKFRTMRESEARESFALPDGCAPGGVEGADRRTKIGRYLRDLSLDELPQFINVLRGEMSLIGPRPERPEFVERFGREIPHYKDRHRVRPGITGWAQVHGLRGQTSIADRVEWDNYYIQNWSPKLELRILAMTLGEVLRFRDSEAPSPLDTLGSETSGQAFCDPVGILRREGALAARGRGSARRSGAYRQSEAHRAAELGDGPADASLEEATAIAY